MYTCSLNFGQYNVIGLTVTRYLLPNDKILDWSKLKALANDEIKLVKMMIFVFDKNIVGKGENAGYQHFLLFPQCFQSAFHTRS